MRQVIFLFIGLVLFFAVSVAAVYSDEQAKPKIDNDTDIVADNNDDKNNNENKINNIAKADPNWKVPNPRVIRLEIEAWFKSTNFADDPVRQNVLSLWNDVVEVDRQVAADNTTDTTEENSVAKNIPVGENANLDLSKLSGTDLFDRAIESLRRASVHVAEYLKLCDTLAWQELPYGQKLVVPQIPLHIHLGESNTTEYLYNSLRIYLALKLVQGRFFSEAINILEEIKPENCINPAELFITKAIIYNGLSRNADGLDAIKNFRIAEKNAVLVSRRHTELAKLLEYELNENKKDNSPNNIAKKMDNARRILGKGDTGKEAQETEEDVLKSLEKLIEEVEAQAKNSQQNDGNNKSDSLQSNNPAQESEIARGKAPGNVDRKEFDQNGGWGNMPAKDREAALSKIEREFPSHYRDIIESYFREMANGDK